MLFCFTFLSYATLKDVLYLFCNHNLIIYKAMDVVAILNDTIDGILTVNVISGRKDTMRIVPEMFYWYNHKTQKTIFLDGLWEYFSKHPSSTKDENQSEEEIGALGQAYFIPTLLLFS